MTNYNINYPLDDGDQILLGNNQTLEDAADLAAGVLADGWLDSDAPEQGVYDSASITLSLGQLTNKKP